MYQEGTPLCPAVLSDVSLVNRGDLIQQLAYRKWKSTILQLLNGLLVPTKGSVRVLILITSTSVNKQIRQIRPMMFMTKSGTTWRKDDFFDGCRCL